MTDNYIPIQTRLILYAPTDLVTPQLVVELVSAFTSGSGNLIGPDDQDKTSLYATGSVTVSGNQITGHTIGIGSGTIVAGDYNYYLTGTYDGGKVTTWVFPVAVSAKLGGSS